MRLVPGAAAAWGADAASEHADCPDDFRDFTDVFGFSGDWGFSGVTSIVRGVFSFSHFSLIRELEREAPFEAAFEVDFDDAFEVDFDAVFDDFVLFLTGCSTGGGDVSVSGGVTFSVGFSDSN